MLQIVWQGPRALQTLRFYWPRLSTLPTAGHVLSADVHNLAQYVHSYSGRQVLCGCRYIYLVQRARGACAL
jgi:hypothetical protein